MDSALNIFIADTDNHRIRKVTAATGIITYGRRHRPTVMSGDGGAATAAQLNSPYGVWVDAAGNIFIADTDNHRIRKVTAATGNISTIVGTRNRRLFRGRGSGHGRTDRLADGSLL